MFMGVGVCSAAEAHCLTLGFLDTSAQTGVMSDRDTEGPGLSVESSSSQSLHPSRHSKPLLSGYPPGTP